MNSIVPRVRFRQARERTGLSPDDVASRCGINSPSIWDIEKSDGELTSCYSPKQIQKFCSALGIRPLDLFSDGITEPPITADNLAQLISSECHSRGITLEKFEEIVGWRLSACINPPEKLLEDMTVDGLQWLCQELHIDWRRVLLSLA